MFDDNRSKKIILVAHCILNQNSLCDGLAKYPGIAKEILNLISSFNVGIIQMPCPELLSLGLSRKNEGGSLEPLTAENTRIRKLLYEKSAFNKLEKIVDAILYQILEYKKYFFEIVGIIGIDPSPSCGVNSTSKDNIEVQGKGVFIELLEQKLMKNGIYIKKTGINFFEIEKTIKEIKKLLS
ncbi:MAG: DUF523 domain-containing protein [bacterium]|nr:DUF523 domain-containing protein [bacterium]